MKTKTDSVEKETEFETLPMRHAKAYIEDGVGGYEIPKIGDHVIVRNQDCVITKVWPMGTIDVLTVNGNRAYRVSGLPLTLKFQSQTLHGNSEYVSGL